MRGLLKIDYRGQVGRVDLGRDRATLGSGVEDTISIPEGPFCAADLVFEWNWQRATWIMKRSGSTGLPLKLNREPFPESGLRVLQDGDMLEAEGFFAEFERHPDVPLLNGVPAEEILLDNSPLIVGRAEATGSRSGERRWDLDAEDPAISKVHVRILPENGHFVIADESRFGTELNGMAFTRERLVFGDRFKIRDYMFEFVGDRLRRVDRGDVGRICAANLTVVAGGRKILDSLSMTVESGEFIGILGGSGQGKSTLLNALCGTNPAQSGEVRLNGQTLPRGGASPGLGIGYVPQDDIVHRELTVEEALKFSARLRLALPPGEIDALVDRTIQRLGLAEHRVKKIAMLSGGQRKRVSIGIELLAKPSILFLDEPSSGLDPATEEGLMVLLQSLTLTNLTVVCTTHVLQKAYLFDRLCFIQGGRLIFMGTSDEARSHFLAESTGEPGDNIRNTPLERIYSLLDRSPRSAKEWEEIFSASTIAGRCRNAASPLSAPTANPAEQPSLPTSDSSRKSVGYFTKLRILLQRQWRILLSDRLNLLFLLAQALVIGLLIGWVADDAALRSFLCVVATLWFGCSNGAQQIVAELPIFRRERVCGQSLNGYLQSKLLFLGALTLCQAVLLSLAIRGTAHVFHTPDFDGKAFREALVERWAPLVEDRGAVSESGFEAQSEESPPEASSGTETAAPAAAAAPPRKPSAPVQHAISAIAWWFGLRDNILQSGDRWKSDEDGTPIRDASGRMTVRRGLSVPAVLTGALGFRMLALLAASAIGVAMGLAISALVRSPTQAVMWVPLILIPQILFGGFVVTLPEMNKSTRVFSQIVPSFLVQRIMDVSGIFGQSTPFLSNRTKIPLFLTADGAKETIEWEESGRQRTQDYDKLSDHNTSWQNLLVYSSKTGQHKHEVQPGKGPVRYRDTIESRRDVAYTKGTVFRFSGPAWLSLQITALWLAICYGATLLGLKAKQIGK